MHDYSLFLVESFEIIGLSLVVSSLLDIRKTEFNIYFMSRFAVSPKSGTPKIRILQMEIIRKCKANKKPNIPKKEESRIQANLTILIAPIKGVINECEGGN